MDNDLLARLKLAAYPGQSAPESFSLPSSITGPLTFDGIKQEIEQVHLFPKDSFSLQWLNKCQEQFERDQEFSTLLTTEPSPAGTRIEISRIDVRGTNGAYREKSVFGNLATAAANESGSHQPQHLTAKNSTSFARAPAKRSEFVRGKAGFFPFTPGGLDKEEIKSTLPVKWNGVDELDLAATTAELENDLAIDQETLLTIPPGFQRGMFTTGDDENDGQGSRHQHVFNISEMVLLSGSADLDVRDQDESDELLEPIAKDTIPASQSERLKTKQQAQEKATSSKAVVDDGEDAIDDLLPVAAPSLLPKRNNAASVIKKREWAHVVDVNEPFTDFHEKVPEMAHPYPFELDTFQKRAVYHLEKGESVFVAAHTSAGKTVVAEYAIALAARHMTKAIYTSPIKALSNQKFRDFKGTFEEVGILTGDVQINPEASCLIMTTEILRSMLYRGADLIRDVEFVIFDEVHYVNDLERGVVWEEVIIMLPAHVTLILLSATVPNTKEFADWVGRTKKKDIYVISTPKRPVPLEHHLFANRDLFKIVDAKSTWQSLGYKNAVDALTKKEKEVKPSGPGQRGGRGGFVVQGRGGSRGGGATGGSGGWRNEKQDRNLFTHLVGFLNKKALLPVVVFTFSKKKCEEYASGLSSTDLMTSSQKSEIHVFIERSLVRLRGTDRELPQVQRMRDLLSRGIAVHHGGLLPILKEMVEILFGRGLVKVLFATETFAMGVNMPARTVVFSGIRKHDGRSFRDLLPGEYTQMSGRAGRRGLDPTGMVIIACGGDAPPDTTTLQEMLLGKATKLLSQFRLTYNMILNLLRVEALRVEEMIKRSFSENSAQKALPEKQLMFAESAKSMENLKKLDCTICNNDIREFYSLSSRVINLNHTLMDRILIAPIGVKALGTGRVVVLNSGFHRNTLAVILKPASAASAKVAQGKSFWCLIPVEAQDGTKAGGAARATNDPLPVTRLQPLDGARCTQVVELVVFSDIGHVTDTVIRVDAGLVIDKADEQEMTRVRQDVVRYANRVEDEDFGQVKEFDWVKIKELDFQERLREKQALMARLMKFQCNKCPDLMEHYSMVHSERTLQLKLEELQHTISDQNLELLPDYHQRINILKELQYLDPEHSTVQLKGRVACEINTADELILTELILDNMLADFEPAEIVALLSCFVFQEKNASEPSLSPTLTKGRDMILNIEQVIAQVQSAHGLEGTTAPGSSALKFGLVEVVYEWAMGMTFKQITELTDVQEGSIVRCIHRLDETCNEVKNAARMIGDAALYTKMETAGQAIKRDIVFAASLYY